MHIALYKKQTAISKMNLLRLVVDKTVETQCKVSASEKNNRDDTTNGSRLHVGDWKKSN